MASATFALNAFACGAHAVFLQKARNFLGALVGSDEFFGGGDLHHQHLVCPLDEGQGVGNRAIGLAAFLPADQNAAGLEVVLSARSDQHRPSRDHHQKARILLAQGIGGAPKALSGHHDVGRF